MRRSSLVLAVGLAALLQAADAGAAGRPDPRRRAGSLELLWHAAGGSPFHRVLVVDGELIWMDAYTLERRALETGAPLGSLKIGESAACISSLAPLHAVGDVIVGSPCGGDPARPGARSADPTRIVAFEPRTGAFRWTIRFNGVAGSVVDATPERLLVSTLRRPAGALLSGLVRLDLPARRERWRREFDGMVAWRGLDRGGGRSYALVAADGAREAAVIAVDELVSSVRWQIPARGAAGLVEADGRVVLAVPGERALLVLDGASGATIARHVVEDMCPWTCLEVHGSTAFVLECGARREEHFGRLVARDVVTGARRWSLPGVAWEGGPAVLADDLALVPRDPGLNVAVDPRDGARLWPDVPFGEHTMRATLAGRDVLITWFAGHLVAYRPREAVAPAEVAVIEGVASIDGRPREGLVVRVGGARVTTGPRGRFKARARVDNVVRVEIDPASARQRLAPRLGRDMVLFSDPVFVFRDGSRRYSVAVEASGVTAAEWQSG